MRAALVEADAKGLWEVGAHLNAALVSLTGTGVVPPPCGKNADEQSGK